VAYILGVGHSGSTLFDLLISAHPQAVSVGEVKFLPDYWQEKRRKTPRTPFGNECTCGTPSLKDCPFWAGVDLYLKEMRRGGISGLFDPVKSDCLQQGSNSLLFDAVTKVSCARLVVDSSKDAVRMMQLFSEPALHVIPIFLWRNPISVVGSHRKRGEGLWITSIGVVLQTLRIALALRGRRFLFVQYHEITKDAEGVLAEVMPFLGLSYVPTQLNFTYGEKHLIGGNRMRRKSTSCITVNDHDKSAQLNFLETMLVRILVWPAQIMSSSIRRRSVGSEHST